MLNDVWTSLVNEVDATKKHYEELEAAMMMTNNCPNDGISALDARVDKCEDKHRTLCNVMEDIWTTVNKQQCLMYDMDKQISFYSSVVIQLEGKKAEEVKDCFDMLEQCIAGQDDQIKVLLHHLTAAEEGHCRCRESTPKVISCRCFNLTMKLTEDVQETKVELETGGLEYEDEEVEAFRCSLILLELTEVSFSRITVPTLLCLVGRRSMCWFLKKKHLRRRISMVVPWLRVKRAFTVMWGYLLLWFHPSRSQSLPL